MTDTDNSSSSAISSNNRRMHHDITTIGSEQNTSSRSMNPSHPSRRNESPLSGKIEKLEVRTDSRHIISYRLKYNPEFDRTASNTGGRNMVFPAAEKKRYYPGYDCNSFERKVLQKRETPKTPLFSLNSDSIKEVNQFVEPPKRISAKKIMLRE
mmetsp:Transcript_10670/g.16187  ORF Transcript_10670/g.16187 Transcript_10670/m.16187 type:complete len:154 (-) Transcript_10670:260-721(-)